MTAIVLFIIQKNKLRGLAGTERNYFSHVVRLGVQCQSRRMSWCYRGVSVILHIIFVCIHTTTYMFKDKRNRKENTGRKKKKINSIMTCHEWQNSISGESDSIYALVH